MTVQSLPWAIQGQSHSAEVGRNVLAAMFGAPVAALVEGISITTAGGAHGVVNSGDLVVTQRGAGANMSVDVAAGRALIRSTEASSLAAGAYTFLNDATVNLVISAADPTNPRIDLVIAQVRDSNYSGANTDARLAVVAGTPAGSPVTPAVPDSCVVLAQVAVAALAGSITNANITDKRTRAYALGGTAVCTSATRPSGASLFSGLRIYETDTSRELVYDGTGFVIMSEPLQAWTPTISNITVGNGTKTGGYVRCNGWIDIFGSFTLGSTSAVTGAPAVTLPINAASTVLPPMFHANALDSAVAEYLFACTSVTTSSFTIATQLVSGTYSLMQAVSGTVPLTWGTSDGFYFGGRYPMTTRYS